MTIGRIPAGAHNAITDVAGCASGTPRIVSGEGPLTVGKGPVRTGVTVIVPHEGDIGAEPLFAGYHVLNGNGEMTAPLGQGVRDADLAHRHHQHAQRRRRA